MSLRVAISKNIWFLNKPQQTKSSDVVFILNKLYYMMENVNLEMSPGEEAMEIDAEESAQEVWRGRKKVWSMRNNAARQMPSRHGQVVAASLSDGPEDLELMERSAHVSLEEQVEEQADEIVRHMELDPQLMQDSPEAEEFRKEALRELPQCLTMKRTVRAKISASVSIKSKRRPISLYKRFKYRLSFVFKRLRERTKDFFFSIDLWYEPIRTVEGHFGSAVGSYFYFLRTLFILNAILTVFVLSFIILPQILHDVYLPKNNTTNVDINNIVLDILSGQGALEDTVLFYGHYHNDIIKESSYNMTFAYFFTMAAMYSLLFVLLSVRTAWSYRRHFIETAGALGQVYAVKVFCGWDFGIATRSAAANNSRNMYNELKELLSEKNKKHIELSKCVKLSLLFVDVTMNLLVLSLIGGFLTLFWWLLDKWAGPQQGPYGNLAMAAIVTTVLTIGPLLFSRIVRLESYTARTSLYVTLVRSFVLDAGTLLLLLVFWFRRDDGCWETTMGQELYRLVILDIVFSLILIPLIEFIRGLIFKWVFPDYAIEFDLAYNSLCLVYKQSLLWLGLVFSPFLAIILSVELAITFYVRRAVAMRVCRPAHKLWRAAQTQTALNLLVYLSLLASLCVLGFVVIRSASQQCGPFQRYEYVYMVLTEGVLKLSQRQTLRAVLVFVTRPGVIGLLLLLMCVAAYYARSRAQAHRSMVLILKEMLALEAKDKEFLLSAIAKVSNGEWLYTPRNISQADDSHTWRYLNDDKIRKPSNAEFHLQRASAISRPLGQQDHRPTSYFKVDRPKSQVRDDLKRDEDGETDSSFSWQGSTGRLSEGQSPVHHNAKKLR